MNETGSANTPAAPEHVMGLTEKVVRVWQSFCNWVWLPPREADNLGFRLLRGILRIIFISSNHPS